METEIRKKWFHQLIKKCNDVCIVLKTILGSSGYKLLSLAESQSKNSLSLIKI